MKRAVVSGEEAETGISTGGEKLVYKQKLRKYITNCNGESEPLAAWSTPGESGLFNRPRESNPRHLLCYIVTRKLRFYKWSRGEIEPQRACLLPYLAINCEDIIGPIISKRGDQYIT